MTAAEQALLRKARAGAAIGPADIVQTITSMDELRGYAGALKAAGGLNGPAITAIEDRRRQMGWVR
jgi:hypothetical protein